jgi:ribosomal protein L37AE/L43A
MIFADYWTCDKCKQPHYGMCYKCGKCGRKFENGIMTNYDEFPSSEED